MMPMQNLDAPIDRSTPRPTSPDPELPTPGLATALYLFASLGLIAAGLVLVVALSGMSAPDSREPSPFLVVGIAALSCLLLFAIGSILTLLTRIELHLRPKSGSGSV